MPQPAFGDGRHSTVGRYGDRPLFVASVFCGKNEDEGDPGENHARTEHVDRMASAVEKLQADTGQRNQRRNPNRFYGHRVFPALRFGLRSTHGQMHHRPTLRLRPVVL